MLRSLLLLSLIYSFTSCKKNWLDVNYNPRDLTGTSATSDLVLPALLERCVSPGSHLALELWMGYWSHWNIPPTTPIVTLNRVEINGLQLAAPQSIPPAEIFFLEDVSRRQDQLFYLGIAKVIRAIKWSQGVDMINNMPYTDAYKSDILQPRYDDGRAIYDDLFKQLDSATGFIKAANEFQSVKINTADLVFHGDKLKWYKLINTVKLRLLIHQANRTDRQAFINQALQVIKTEGSGFLGTGEGANINPGYNEKFPNRVNPYFGYFSSHNQLYGGGFYDAETQVTSSQLAHANLYAMELLKADHDPRLELFYSTVDIPTPAGADEPYTQSAPLEFRGNKYGFSNNPTQYPYQDASFVSAVGGSRNTALVNTASKGIIKGRNMDSWLLTSIESLFLQAEAVQRGWIPGDAEQYYIDAVKESFRWLNAGGNSSDPSTSDAVFDQWYALEAAAGNERVSWTAAPDKYKLLCFQKYMAFNGIEPLESWVDYRRNGRFPAVPVSAGAIAGATVPLRVLFNSEEYITNADNLKALGTVDMFTSKIWWMP